MERFFMVWCENTREVTHKHMNNQDARNEAERLARKHPGSKFHVLESVATCEIRDIVWIEHDGLPY